jgi:hypothetical protein
VLVFLRQWDRISVRLVYECNAEHNDNLCTPPGTIMWCVLRFFAHRTSVTILGRENINVDTFSTGKTVCDFDLGGSSTRYRPKYIRMISSITNHQINEQKQQQQRQKLSLTNVLKQWIVQQTNAIVPS